MGTLKKYSHSDAYKDAENVLSQAVGLGEDVTFALDALHSLQNGKIKNASDAKEAIAVVTGTLERLSSRIPGAGDAINTLNCRSSDQI